MEERRFVLVLAASAPDQDRYAPVTAARLIWLLPSAWAAALYRSSGRPAVVIETPREVSLDDVVAAGRAAFDDTMMRHWQLAECVPLPEGGGPPALCDPW